MSDPLTARQYEFADRLSDLLREYADVAGPVQNPLDEIMDAAAMAEARPLANAALTEWVLVMAWTDLDDGESYVTKANQPGMLNHHQLGLLRSWIVELER